MANAENGKHKVLEGRNEVRTERLTETEKTEELEMKEVRK